jgi:bifunctional DNA-binding transcriptional regulator/antitoxin component of YhaV-PrlF toxin-antitoxin module
MLWLPVNRIIGNSMILRSAIMPSLEASRVCKPGTVIIPARLCCRFGIEEGGFVIAEEREDGIRIRPAPASPVEGYTRSAKRNSSSTIPSKQRIMQMQS